MGTFPDGTFDVAMVGFGIRNVTHLKSGFTEMHRMLKPGGRLLCLEFSRPTNALFRALYDFYSFNIMPLWESCLSVRPSLTPACRKPSVCFPCRRNFPFCWQV